LTFSGSTFPALGRCIGSSFNLRYIILSKLFILFPLLI